MGLNGSLYNYIALIAILLLLASNLCFQTQTSHPQLQNVHPGINFQNYDWHYQANEGSYPLVAIAGWYG